MTDEDIFFTHTVVGQAMSVEMGRPIDRTSTYEEVESMGLQVSLTDGRISLPRIWKDWCLFHGAYPYVGLPRRRPGHWRRWLERHALVLGTSGLLTLISAIMLMMLLIWSPGFLDLLQIPTKLPSEPTL